MLTFILDIGDVTVQVAESGRVGISSKHSSAPPLYPLSGSGNYLRQSLALNNDGDTTMYLFLLLLFCFLLLHQLFNFYQINRYNITSTVIVPLIAPLLDVIDNKQLSYTLQLYSDYYTSLGIISLYLSLRKL